MDVRNPVSGGGVVTDSAVADQITNGTQTKAALSASTALKDALIPVATSNGGFNATSAQATSGTGRQPWVLTRPVTDLAAVWSNSFLSSQIDTDGATDLVIGAAFEISGAIYRVLFNGRTQVTISPGGFTACDPIPVDLPAGTVVWIRTFVASGTWYSHSSSQAPGSGGWTATSDLTAPGSAAIPDSTSFAAIPGPATLLGRGPGARRALVRVGDSIAFGQGDGITGSMAYNAVSPKLGRGGWIGKAVTAAGVGEVNAATPSDRAALFAVLLNRRLRAQLLRYASTAVIGYGRNDISSGQSLTQVQVNLLNIAGVISTRGIKTLVATITVQTTSTDGWMTTASQAPTSNDSVRSAVNAWLRAGAPVTIAGGVVTAVSAGTAGAVLAPVYGPTGMLVTPGAGSGHPVSAVIDPAAAVEDNGVWKAAVNVRSVSDAATNGAVMTSATAAFTSADVGRQVAITGAGTSGGLYVGIIKIVSNATTTVLATTAPTNVTGASMTIGDAYAYDGLHPGPTGHDAMAGALPSALID